nr:immunoglobulin heavy chain junction region [Macaca mulatta]MOW45545.1 immunoglobulin heavy chain junction region [Macaca mulatta]MOW45587.1 immunoglobulin heavy chain junction region [Macaca mulatta]MOW45610.1 immunoglobulin heavy chain junction region [Macaca mulatta]MOW45795.1 immunoglobulin heavy chain junction region [Macaca mulatta]
CAREDPTVVHFDFW